MEKRIYRKAVMGGATSLVCGIVVILTGVVTGILLIVSGGSLISAGKNK